MKGTQGLGELGQNLSLGPQTNHKRNDKTITHSGASSALANKGMAIAVLGSRVLRYGLVHTLNQTPIDSVEQLRAMLRVLRLGQAVVLQIERTGKLQYVAFDWGD